MDIYVQLFDPSGAALIGGTSGGLQVNDSAIELENTDQVSPCVSFVGNDVAVVWAGPPLDTCDGYNGIFARRLRVTYNGSN